MTQRFSDPDLIDAVIAERHQLPAAPATVIPDSRAARRDVRAAKRAVWEPKGNILGVLCRPMHAPDVAKFTGIALGTVILTLQELEPAGKVRKTGERRMGWDGNFYDLWEKAPT